MESKIRIGSELKIEALQEIKQEIGKRIKELESVPEPKQSPYGWVPKEGEVYWFIAPGKCHENTNDGEDFDCLAIEMGNCYPTEAAAIHARDRQIARTELVQAIAKENDGWVPDWNNDREMKFNYYHDGEKNIIVMSSNASQILPIELYCKSYDWLYSQIKELGPNKIRLAMGWD